jgi:hypothetical protein
METVLRLVAVAGAAAHLYFSYRGAVQWDVPVVKKAAPSWIEASMDLEDAYSHVTWAKNLAVFIGVYNLVLAIGFNWLAIAGEDVAGPLGVFLAIWLLGSALAAAYTKVLPAFYAQGALGVVLLIVALAVES